MPESSKKKNMIAPVNIDVSSTVGDFVYFVYLEYLNFSCRWTESFFKLFVKGSPPKFQEPWLMNKKFPAKFCKRTPFQLENFERKTKNKENLQI